jgi:hypothetical protein
VLVLRSVAAMCPETPAAGYPAEQEVDVLLAAIDIALPVLARETGHGPPASDAAVLVESIRALIITAANSIIARMVLTPRAKLRMVAAMLQRGRLLGWFSWLGRCGEGRVGQAVLAVVLKAITGDHRTREGHAEPDRMSISKSKAAEVSALAGILTFVSTSARFTRMHGAWFQSLWLHQRHYSCHIHWLYLAAKRCTTELD